MYLTRVILNPEREGARFLLASPQRLHAAVMKSFSQEMLDQAPTRPLWYVDMNKRDPEVYILASTPADVTHITEQGGRPQDPNGQVTKSYNRMLSQIQDRSKYVFKVRLNPVVRSQGKNLPHVTELQIAEWLETKAATQWGFKIQDLRLSERQNIFFTKSRGSRVTLNTVLAQGILQVNDVSVFRYAFENGLGKGKAYGCGLLLLGRA